MSSVFKDFPGAQTVRLEQNYRSSANILGAANAVIAHNPDRIGKQLWTDSGDGDPIDLYAAYNEVDEARYVVERARQWVRDGGSYGEVAVLYRSNAQSRALEEALISEQLPYRVYGGMRFFERAEIKDALAYLRLLTNRSDDAAFERAVNTPTRGIGDRTLDEVRRLARASALSLWEAAMLCTQQNTLAARARNALASFLSLIGQLHAETGQMELAERIDHVLMRSGLREHWAKESRGGLDSESRTENLDELVSVASRFTRPDDEDSQGMTELVAFLAYASLEAGEGQAQAGEEGVQLMTLHSAKGLEFPIVFLVGLEDGLFPSARSLEESGRLEEERRLAYVGITARGRSWCCATPNHAASTARTTTTCPRASCARFRATCSTKYAPRCRFRALHRWARRAAARCMASWRPRRSSSAPMSNTPSSAAAW